MMLSYEECVEYINNIPKYAKCVSLEDTNKIMNMLTGGKSVPKIIHVAGTNGKGSVCAYLASILRKAGKSVGMFTSPHLVDMRERISLDGKLISKEEFVKHFHKLKDAIENKPINYFTYLFLLAMSYYCQENPDYLILETGLGGRLDATNSVKDKCLTVISEIGFDHMQVLGDTIEKIAGEKAGIVRKDTPLVFINKRKEAADVILAANKEAGNTIDNCFILNYKDIHISEESADYLTYSLDNNYVHIDNIRLNTVAIYQCENASLAIMGIKALNENISDETIREGLEAMHWPGRMEKIAEDIYIDGAHNEDGIQAMLDTVSHMEGKKKLIFAVVSDKDYEVMIRSIVGSQAFEQVMVTTTGQDRKTDADMIKNIFVKEAKDAGIEELKVTTCKGAKEALEAMKEEGYKVIITGSLYLVADIKRALQGAL